MHLASAHTTAAGFGRYRLAVTGLLPPVFHWALPRSSYIPSFRSDVASAAIVLSKIGSSQVSLCAHSSHGEAGSFVLYAMRKQP